MSTHTKPTPAHLSATQRFFLSHKILLSYFFLAALTLAYFALLEAHPVLNDPDSFYHAGVATQMASEKGLRIDFTALPLTTLADNFADHHFLYHVLLIPFVSVFDPLVGIKVAQVFFATTTILIFYAILRRLHIRFAPAYVLLAMVNYQFVFRMALPKASALAIGIFLLTLYFVVTKKPIKLFMASWIYVWLHAGFPLLIAVHGLHLLVELVFNYASLHTPSFVRWKPWLRRHGLLFLSTVVGITTGIVTHPYFPANLAFYWQQTIKIGLLDQAHDIGVGIEWFSKNTNDLLLENSTLFFALFVALIVYVATLRHQSSRSTFFLVLTLTLLFMTRESQRNIEYFVPIAIVAIGLIFTRAYLPLRAFLRAIAEKHMQRYWLPLGAGVVFLLLALTTTTVQHIQKNFNLLYNGFPLTRYADASAWLTNNTESRQRIFHSDWDDFPMLYYHHPDREYISGLDARFFYFKNTERHATWTELVRGQQTENIAATIERTFAADVVLIENIKESFLANAKKDPRMQQAYADDEVTIFTIIDKPAL